MDTTQKKEAAKVAAKKFRKKKEASGMKELRSVYVKEAKYEEIRQKVIEYVKRSTL